eukprot:12159032-Alexandrium_andersonii.AAC.1
MSTHSRISSLAVGSAQGMELRARLLALPGRPVCVLSRPVRGGLAMPAIQRAAVRAVLRGVVEHASPGVALHAD